MEVGAHPTFSDTLIAIPKNNIDLHDPAKDSAWKIGFHKKNAMSKGSMLILRVTQFLFLTFGGN